MLYKAEKLLGPHVHLTQNRKPCVSNVYNGLEKYAVAYITELLHFPCRYSHNLRIEINSLF